MAGELFRRAAGIEVVHIPYIGAAPALNDLIAGRLGYTIDNLAMQLPHVKTGRLRALGVTAKQCVAAAPDVPTLAESGLSGYEYLPWMGIVAPAGTPREVVARLHAQLIRALGTPAAKEWYAAQGGDIVGDTPAEFVTVIRADLQRWRTIVREAGIKAEWDHRCRAWHPLTVTHAPELHSPTRPTRWLPHAPISPDQAAEHL